MWSWCNQDCLGKEGVPAGPGSTEDVHSEGARAFVRKSTLLERCGYVRCCGHKSAVAREKLRVGERLWTRGCA